MPLQFPKLPPPQVALCTTFYHALPRFTHQQLRSWLQDFLHEGLDPGGIDGPSCLAWQMKPVPIRSVFGGLEKGPPRENSSSNLKLEYRIATSKTWIHALTMGTLHPRSSDLSLVQQHKCHFGQGTAAATLPLVPDLVRSRSSRARRSLGPPECSEWGPRSSRRACEGTERFTLTNPFHKYQTPPRNHGRRI